MLIRRRARVFSSSVLTTGELGLLISVPSVDRPHSLLYEVRQCEDVERMLFFILVSKCLSWMLRTKSCLKKTFKFRSMIVSPQKPKRMSMSRPYFTRSMIASQIASRESFTISFPRRLREVREACQVPGGCDGNRVAVDHLEALLVNCVLTLCRHDLLLPRVVVQVVL